MSVMIVQRRKIGNVFVLTWLIFAGPVTFIDCIVICSYFLSKKPAETRQSELHDAISPLLVEVTAASVSDWIRDKQLSQFLLAVVQYSSNDVTAILENVVSLLEQPFDEEVSWLLYCVL